MLICKERVMAMRMPVAALAVLAAAATAAHATPKDYCEAYARDFADRGPKEETAWAQRQAGAMKDCMLQFQPAASEPVEPAAPPKATRKVAKSQPRKAKPQPIVEAEIVEPLPEPAVIVAPDIAPPAKPDKKAVEPAKRKTLFAKIFKPKPDEIAVVKSGKPEPFSQAWLDYCDRKYASFNRDTGTYTSYKGIERKCLVTD